MKMQAFRRSESDEESHYQGYSHFEIEAQGTTRTSLREQRILSVDIMTVLAGLGSLTVRRWGSSIFWRPHTHEVKEGCGGWIAPSGGPLSHCCIDILLKKSESEL